MNQRPKYNKVLEENIANLCDLGLNNDFSGKHQKHIQWKKKQVTQTSLNLKRLCFKGHYLESEKKPHGMKITYLPIIYLVRNLYPGYLKISYNSTKRQANFKNRQKIWIHFSKGGIQMTNKHIKKCLTSFVIGSGIENGTVTLENSSEIPQKVKHKIIIWPSNPTPKYIPKRNKSISIKTCAWMFIAALIIIAKK